MKKVMNVTITVLIMLLITAPFVFMLAKHGVPDAIGNLGPARISSNKLSFNLDDSFYPGDSISKTKEIKTEFASFCTIGVDSKIVSSSNHVEDMMEITITHKETGFVIYSGDLKDLNTSQNREQCSLFGVKSTYVIELKFKEEAGNEYMNSFLMVNLNWNLERSAQGMEHNKKLFIAVMSLIVLLLFSLILGVTSYIQGRQVLEDNGVFVSTGNIKINLNDNEKIIDGSCLFEPGQVYKKDFTIENQSKCGVKYDIYFKNVSNNLGAEINIVIKDGELVIASGTLDNFTLENIVSQNNYLERMEKKTLTMYFEFSSSAGNEFKGQVVTFDVCARATQSTK